MLYVLLGTGVLLIAGGLWLRHHIATAVPSPQSPAAAVMEIENELDGLTRQLFVYEDGLVIYFEQTGVRMPTWEHPAIRVWRTGRLDRDDMDKLLSILRDSNFDALAGEYAYHSSPAANSTFGMFSIYFREVDKKIIARGYRIETDDTDAPELPSPLNTIHDTLNDIIENKTKEVARQSHY